MFAAGNKTNYFTTKGSKSSGSMWSRVASSILRSGERHRVTFMTAFRAGLVEPKFFSLPNTVAEDTVISFLSLHDAMMVRVASTQLRDFVESSLARRNMVDFEQVGISDEGFQLIFSLSTHAKALVLSGNLQLSYGIANAHLAKNFKQLLEIHVTECPGLKATVSMPETPGLPPMAQIFSLCSQLQVVECDALCDKALGVLANQCGHSLRELSCRESGHHVTGVGILELVQKSPHLRALDIAWCGLGDEHLQTIANVSSVRERLEKLDISGCCDVREPTHQHRAFWLTEEGVALAILRMHALREFACNGLFPEGPLFQTLADHRGFPVDADPQAPRAGMRLVRSTFTALRLGDCPRLQSHEALRSFARAVGPNLRSLELKGCKEISDIGGLCELVKACPQLEELCMCGCEGVSNVLMQTLASSCPGLRKVVLRRAEHISDVGVASLVRGCPQLTYLDLSGCHGITNATLFHLTHCKNLETLLLYCCSAITDYGVLQVLGIKAPTMCGDDAEAGEEEARSEAATAAATFSLLTDKSAVIGPVAWPQLKHLDLSWCFHVSVPCFIAVVQRLKALRRLSLEGFDHFTTEDVARIRCFGPRVKIEATHHEDDDIERHIQHLHRLNMVDEKRMRELRILREKQDLNSLRQTLPQLALNQKGGRKSMRRKGSGPGDYPHHILLTQPAPSGRRLRGLSLPTAASFLASNQETPSSPSHSPRYEYNPEEHDFPRVTSSPRSPEEMTLVRRVSLEDLEAIEFGTSLSSLPADDILMGSPALQDSMQDGSSEHQVMGRPRAYSEALTGTSNCSDNTIMATKSDSFTTILRKTSFSEKTNKYCGSTSELMYRRRFGDDKQDISRLEAFSAAK